MAKNYQKGPIIPGQAVIQTAKEKNTKVVEVTLSTGVRARIKTVAASLIDKVTSRLVEPEVPMEMNPDKQREEANPLSPKYLAAMREYNKARGEAAIEAMVMFGVELLDEIPPDSEWLDQLQVLAKHDRLDLSKFDLQNPIEKEYLYKIFIAVGTPDLALVMASAGIPTEAMNRAADSFQRKDEGGTDPDDKAS
jgi:hypothetical protein